MKSIKKLLAVLCAATMLVGMMGTVVLAEGEAAELVIQMTSANADAGIIVEHSSGAWTKEPAAKDIPAYYQISANNVNRYLTFYPEKAGLKAGIYACYQITRPFVNSNSWTAPEHRFDFYGKRTADAEESELMGTSFASVGANGATKTTYSGYIGTYTFSGTEDESIRYGFPKTFSVNARFSGLQFVPVTDGAVSKYYTVTKNNPLTMAIDIDALGEFRSIAYTPTAESCDAMQGSVQVDGNTFTYTPAENYIGADSFVLEGALNGCKVTLTVNLNVVDDSAIYFDDVSGEAIGAYVNTTENLGFGGSSSYFNGNSGYSWSISDIDEGVYEVFYHKTGDDKADPSLSLTLVHNGVTEELGISGLDDGREEWVSVGVFDFAGNGEETLSVLRKNSSGKYYGFADAVKLVPVPENFDKEIVMFADDTYRDSVLLTYDREDSALSPQSVSLQPTNGVAEIDGGFVVYTPNSGYTGEDIFTITCGDYSVNYSVTISSLPSEITAERGDTGVTTSGVSNANAKGATKNVSFYSNTAGAYMQWTIPEGTTPGYYQVSVWKMNQTSAKSAAKMEISDNGGADTDVFVQKGLSYTGQAMPTAGEWIPVGIYNFTGNGEEYIKMIDLATTKATELDTVTSTIERLRMGGFKITPVASVGTADVSDVTYTKEDASVTLESLPASKINVMSEVELTNKTAQGKAVTVLNAVYNNSELVNIYVEKQYLAPYSVKEMDAVAKLAAAAEGDDYQIKTFIWEAGTLKPVMQTPAVLD